MEAITAPLELKFASDEAGAFEGLASPYGNVDSHGDTVAPGAFAATLSEHKARGSMPVMYVMHGPAMGADHWPAGRWLDMEERAEGLFVKGQLLGLDTDRGRFTHSLMRGGALSGLSIGFRVPPGGASYPKAAKPGDARRVLKMVQLAEVSLVPRGSNPRALVTAIKAEAELAREIEEFRNRVASGDVTLREWERWLRDVAGLTRAQAEAFAGRGFKALNARESDASEAKSAAMRGAIETIDAQLQGFSLPRF